MPIDFYYYPASPPCRSIMLLAKAIGVHLNLKSLNLLNGEHMTPSFLKINPQHTLPTMDDNGFILNESRAIMGYLVDKYAKNDSLYPNDPKKRGKVDEMLYFDIGALYDNVLKCYFPIVFGKRNTLREEDVQAVENSCEILNTLLEDREFVAGDTLTIADFSISTTIRVLEMFGFDIGRYDNVAAWNNRCTEILDKFGYEEVHSPGAKMVADMYWPNLQESN